MLDGFYFYFIRSRCKELSALNLILDFIRGSSLSLVGVHHLSDGISDLVRNVRGGNWYDDAGLFLWLSIRRIVSDPVKQPLLSTQRDLSLPFVKYQSYFLKDSLRTRLCELFPHEQQLNLFHTTDDVAEIVESIFSMSPADKTSVLRILSDCTGTDIASLF